MAGAGGKGFFDRTWADTFSESRDVANRTTPINLPYGRQVLEIEGRGGVGTKAYVRPAYTDGADYPLVYSVEPAYQTTTAAYSVITYYPTRYINSHPPSPSHPTGGYSVSAAYPSRYTTPTGPNAAYSVSVNYPPTYATQPAFETVTFQPTTYTVEPASEFSAYIFEGAYTEAAYAFYGFQPTTYTVYPAYETAYTYPNSYTVQPAGATYYQYPTSYTKEPASEFSYTQPGTYTSSLVTDGTTYTVLVYGDKGGYRTRNNWTTAYSVAGGGTTYADQPATWTSAAGAYSASPYPTNWTVNYGATVYADNPATWTKEPSNWYVQNSYPARYYPSSYYVSYYNQPITYTVEPASFTYADHPSITYVQQAAYTGYTTYPSRFQTQGAYTVTTQYPTRYYNTHPPSPGFPSGGYAVSTQYPSNVQYYPARYTTSGGYTLQTNYPSVYTAGIDGEDTSVSISAADGTSYQFVAPGAPAPSSSGYSLAYRTIIVYGEKSGYRVQGVYVPGQYTTPSVPNAVYTVLDAPQLTGVYQSSVNAYVGWSRNNSLASEKGYINIRYDGDPETV